MQTLKPDVRAAILNAATDEFYLHGFKRASLREIAKGADITAGNIYSYFDNKLALLDAVLEPTFETLKKIFSYPVINQENLQPTLLSITKDIEHIFLENRKRAYILFHHVEGTPYENVRQEITDTLSNCIRTEIMVMQENAPIDATLADIYAASMMEGILKSFDLCGGDRELLHHVLTDLLGLFFGKAAFELKRMEPL